MLANASSDGSGRYDGFLKGTRERGVNNRGAAISRPVAWTAHIWKDRDCLYYDEMTEGVDGAWNDSRGHAAYSLWGLKRIQRSAR